MSKDIFSIGDKVRIIGEDESWEVGTVVTVCRVDGDGIPMCEDGEGRTHYVNQERAELVEDDMVNHPPHYNSHPSGVECIEITRHMGYNLGNAIKYIWRCDLKRDAIEDLEKAVFYLQDEIAKRKAASEVSTPDAA